MIATKTTIGGLAPTLFDIGAVKARADREASFKRREVPDWPPRGKTPRPGFTSF
jgi:hypothetical protein